MNQVLTETQAPPIEQARQAIESYQLEHAQTQDDLESFKAENSEKLSAIRAELTNPERHPLFEELDRLQTSTKQPVKKLIEQNRSLREEMGWQGEVLLPGYWREFNSPLVLAEFNRRVAISENVGQLATVLRANDKGPIVRITGVSEDIQFYPPSSYLPTPEVAILVCDNPKTEVVVGSISQSDTEPKFNTKSKFKEFYNRSEDTSYSVPLRMCGDTTGTISAYSMPIDDIALQERVDRPLYKEHTETEGRIIIKTKQVRVPITSGSSDDIGYFPYEEAKGRDLLNIDAPWRTAADHEFSDSTLLYRPKQTLGRGEEYYQSVLVLPTEDNPVYEARILGEDSEIVLPAPRHNSIWLVGAKAIEEHLEDAISEVAAPEQKTRGTDQAILAATRDLVESIASR